MKPRSELFGMTPELRKLEIVSGHELEDADFDDDLDDLYVILPFPKEKDWEWAEGVRIWCYNVSGKKERAAFCSVVYLGQETIAWCLPSGAKDTDIREIEIKTKD